LVFKSKNEKRHLFSFYLKYEAYEVMPIGFLATNK